MDVPVTTVTNQAVTIWNDRRRNKKPLPLLQPSRDFGNAVPQGGMKNAEMSWEHPGRKWRFEEHWTYWKMGKSSIYLFIEKWESHLLSSISIGDVSENRNRGRKLFSMIWTGFLGELLWPPRLNGGAGCQCPIIDAEKSWRKEWYS